MKKATVAPVSLGVEGEEYTSENYTAPGPSMYFASNDATDKFISRYFCPTACTVSPLSLFLTLHKHAPFRTHMRTFFWFSYVARCPS